MYIYLIFHTCSDKAYLWLSTQPTTVYVSQFRQIVNIKNNTILFNFVKIDKRCVIWFHDNVRNQENLCWIAKIYLRVIFFYGIEALGNFIVTQSFLPDRKALVFPAEEVVRYLSLQWISHATQHGITIPTQIFKKYIIFT